VRVTLLAAGSRGDVQPFVALGAELRRRGHTVRLATHRDFQSLAEDAGLEYWALPSGPSDIPSSANSPLRLFRALVRHLDHMGPELAAQTLAASVGAEVVVENMLSHTEAVESLTMPWCMALYVPLMPTSVFPAPGLPTLPLGPRYNRLTHAAAYRLQDQAVVRWLGLASRWVRFPWQQLTRNRPALFAFSPSVIPRPADWPPTCHVTGYWFWERTYEPSEMLAAFLEKGPPPVALTFGSLWRFAPIGATQIAVEAASRAGRPLIVMGDPEAAAPDGTLQLSEVDHHWLFPRTAAVIHHGGAGTTAAALRAGVPQVAVPFFADQPFWAARLRALGVAPPAVPMRRLSADRLGAAVAAALSDTGMRDRATRVGAVLRSEDGVGRACEVLEGWAADRANT
jgi:UDP:flavonoid glycosyltransferase YjiC (YdhE family)